jgi:hypothetical protein
MDRPFRRQYRLQSSVVLLMLQAVATVLHVFPNLIYSTHGIRTTTRIVAEIQSLGPIWVFAFGLSSIALVTTLWFKRGETYGHLACATIWVMYATGLWLGTFVEKPHGTVFFPVVASFIVAFHSIVAASYNEDEANKGGRPRP